MHINVEFEKALNSKNQLLEDSKRTQRFTYFKKTMGNMIPTETFIPSQLVMMAWYLLELALM